MGFGEVDYPDSRLMQAAEVRSPSKSSPKDECLVMFSGGRDSTIAALRLSRRNVAVRLPDGVPHGARDRFDSSHQIGEVDR
jgi:hypothetical protein